MRHVVLCKPRTMATKPCKSSVQNCSVLLSAYQIVENESLQDEVLHFRDFVLVLG